MFKHLLNQHTKLEKRLEHVTGNDVESLIIPVRDIHDPAKCPVGLLPWLAWERSVDYWRDDWSEQTKRDVIAASVAVHRKKGTLAAVRQAIAATGLLADVSIPRTDINYVPHSFRIRLDADANPPTPTNAAEIRTQIDHVKPARCAYDLSFTQTAIANNKLRGVGSLMLNREQTMLNAYRSIANATANTVRRASALTLLREAA